MTSSPPGSPAGPADADCLFCKIVAGEISATVVHQSDTTVAFRDLNPQAPTHVLVIPRSHYPTAAALAQGEPTTVARLFDAAREIATQEGLDGTDGGYRMVFNTGPAAHQTVLHAHLHVLGGRQMTWPPG